MSFRWVTAVVSVVVTGGAMLMASAVGSGPAGADPGSSGFVSMPLTRVLDTRSGTGTGGRVGALAANTSVALQVAGVSGVPATGVSAVAINLTVTGTGGAGEVTGYADGTTAPYTSNLNYVTGLTAADLAIVPVGADGKIDLLLRGAGTQLIGDLEGYYLAPATPNTPGDYTPLEPTRILDSRHAIGTAQSTPLANGTTVDLPIAGTDGIPATGIATAAITLTVTGGSAPGDITAYPAGEALPHTSNLDFVKGQTVANLALVPVGPNGHIELHLTGGPVHLIADLSGYTTAPGSGPATTTGSYTPVSPARLLDTRYAIGIPTTTRAAAGQIITLPVAGVAGIPATGVGAVAVNITVTGATGPGIIDAYANGAGIPFGSTLNYTTDQLAANLDVVPVAANGDISIYTPTATHVIVDVAGYYLDPPADTTPPGPVTGLTTTDTTETSTTLTWTDPTDPDLAGLEIRRWVASSGGPTSVSAGTLVANLPADTTTYTDTALTPGTAYGYSVFARDAVPNWAQPAAIDATTTALTWTSRSLDPNRGTPSGISCPTTTLCMAVDLSGFAIRMSGGSWSAPQQVMPPGDPDTGFADVSCTSPTFCLAGVGTSAYVYNGSTWAAVSDPPGPGISRLTCASTTFCLAVSGGTESTFNGSTWSVAKVLSTAPEFDFTALSCASTSFCVTVGMAESNTSTAYVWNGHSWSAGQTTLANAGMVTSLSCPKPNLCLGVTLNGLAVQFDGSAWTAQYAWGRGIGFTGNSISCTSATWCEAVGMAVGTEASHYNGVSWSSLQPLFPQDLGQYISCASTRCEAIDSVGYAKSFDGTSWSATSDADLGQGGLGRVSCRSATSCIDVDGSGNYLSYNGSSWTAPLPVYPPSPLATNASCVPTLCMAIGRDGSAWVFTGTHWLRRGNIGSLNPGPLSCATVSFCMEVTEDNTFTVFNGTSWSKPTSFPDALSDVPQWVSCPRSNYCVTSVGAVGLTVYVYDDGRWAKGVRLSTNWNEAAYDCTTSSFCLFTFGTNSTATFNGTTFQNQPDSDYRMDAVACLSPSDCVATDAEHSVQLWNGSGWDPAETLTVTDIRQQPFWVTCASATSCFATGPNTVWTSS